MGALLGAELGALLLGLVEDCDAASAMMIDGTGLAVPWWALALALVRAAAVGAVLAWVGERMVNRSADRAVRTTSCGQQKRYTTQLPFEHGERHCSSNSPRRCNSLCCHP